jgi:Ser/Thr protein kinase RdoA (MazF antagonist)
MSFPQEIAGKLALACGLGPVASVSPLAGGANNKVYRAETASGPVVLKLYFTHPQDKRDRYVSETYFLRHIRDAKVENAPRLLAWSDADKACLMSMLPGRPAEPADVGESAVDQAMRFFEALNAEPPHLNLPDGSEACFSINQHLGTVSKRLENLKFIADETELHHQARRLVETEILPAWVDTETGLAKAIAGAGLDPSTELPRNLRCVSPSDFGFHNAMIDDANRFSFIDFEYAGLDDAAKMVGDFFNQVSRPVPVSLFTEVRSRVLGVCKGDPDLGSRIDLLLPVYAFKWIAIVLGIFQPVGGSRRAFAGVGRLEGQLEKARSLLTRQKILREVVASVTI